MRQFFENSCLCLFLLALPGVLFASPLDGTWDCSSPAGSLTSTMTFDSDGNVVVDSMGLTLAGKYTLTGNLFSYKLNGGTSTFTNVIKIGTEKYETYPVGRPAEISTCVKGGLRPRQTQAGCKEGDCKNGFGTLVIEGKTYVGQFVNGVIEGKGRLTFGTIAYEGDFHAGEINGRGRLESRSETLWEIYEGEFRNGKRHGKGKITNPTDENSLLTVEGFFADDKYDGTMTIQIKGPTGLVVIRQNYSKGVPGDGEIVWPNGSHYKGGLDARLRRSGVGEMFFVVDQSLYKGEWFENLREGNGVLSSRDGKVIYSGKWRADKRVE